ncbi:LIN1 transcriptase, partial [Polypterus senegalus]|nr:LIN1 transcriptase [Polypterus senegalus]MBN3290185.1 LIN1 transcriptase [Polypterus senegalus]MBN3290355.1 LIN1 transcriptase [Polypterus senegalus]MBN3291072.1 LIN1 transcriptase [Polypterus senegalus]MBN3291193.1 LIN1 transcriptase [Polypterus senegalus]
MTPKTQNQCLHDGTVNFVSWNVKGLNHELKRKKVLSHLTGLNAKIVFLQETHLLSKDQFRLQKDWTGQMFHSSFTKKTRGVGILIHRTVPFVASDVVLDPEGRYVMVMGDLSNCKMILINVYAPNVDDKEFIQNLFASIPNLNTHKLIMAGDFNCVLNPLLDKTSSTGGTATNTAKIITKFITDHNLSDPWRFLNPNSRTYSFYSPVHHCYSRIDYFFIDNNFLPKIKSCKYDAIVISDHAPMILELKLLSPIHSPRRWRLNPLLLADENCTEFISKQIEFFLETNTSPEISAGILWETLKAFLRGQIISYLSHRNKSEAKKVAEIKSEITKIDEEHARLPSETLHKRRQALHSELNLLTTKETEQLIYKSRHHYYEHGEKANKLLAQQIHKQEVRNAISVITNTNGDKIIEHKNIMCTFRDYYKSLYTTEFKEDNIQSNAFLDKLQIPQIDAISVEELDKPLSLSELLDAIKSLQGGKAAGPDGYPAEFYKKFSAQLAPLLLATFTEARDNQSLPQTFRQALITVFPKQNKDLLQCASYRPISLLNNDVKILSKIIARRMEKVLPSIISQDQTGFIRGRHLSSNLRRLFNVIYSPTKSNTPEILLSLDAEKAFDMIEWKYLFTILEKFGFGPNICAWIKLLYTNPEASVCINNICSDYFKLERGTRQGCPLSPLLFAIAIEPLAIHCRNTDQIKGISREGLEQKISLYADDMVLYISDPENSVPAVLAALTEFQKLSGLRINLNKSVLFPVNSQAYNIRLDTLPFIIAEQFKYLGVNITSKHKALYQQNFVVCMEKIKQDLHRWSTLHLTLAGRINTVKMNILPKLLFLFQNIPIYINKSFFKQLDSTITSFIWNSKHPRIKRATLQRQKAEGGMALPNFQFYYWAANIQSIRTWTQIEEHTQAWTAIEVKSCSTSLYSLLCAPINTRYRQYTNNPIVLHSLRIWNQCRKHFKTEKLLSVAPLQKNHLFQPSQTYAVFNIWKKFGINLLRDLYIDNVFASYEQLRSKFNIPATNFFHYLQIRNFVKQNLPDFPHLAPSSTLEKLLLNFKELDSISTIYKILLQSLPFKDPRGHWENDLSINISEKEWKVAMQRIHSSSICAKHTIIQLKIIYRAHLSRLKLSKMFPGHDPTCERCNQAPASLGHMFWACSKLTLFWTKIFNYLSDSLGLTIPPNPLTAVFGVLPEGLKVEKDKQIVIAFTTLLARRLILINWKNPNSPLLSQWETDVLYYLKLEKIKYSVRGSVQTFFKTWQDLISNILK